MDQLITDGGKALISRKVQDILQHLCIKNWNTELHCQHQNAAKRRYNNIKSNLNTVMNMAGVPDNCWLLCLQYIIFIMNHTALELLEWRTLFEKLYGNTPDISMIYRSKFYDKVYVKRDESRGGKQFSSLSNEILCRFVGFSESVGHPMTYIVLIADTNKILFRSRLRLAAILPNLCIDPQPDDNNTTTPRKNEYSTNTIPNSNNDNNRTMATIDFNDMIDWTYLNPPETDGTQRRMNIIQHLDTLYKAINSDPMMVRFKASNSDETITDIITYQQLLDKVEVQDGDTDEWHFTTIINHQGPLKPHDSNYKGSSWNVHIKWENGETTWEPLSLIARSDPVTCAVYAKNNSLLHLPAWTRSRHLAKRKNRLSMMANQTKLKSFRNRPVFKFGVQIPRDHQHAMELDKANGNNL